MSALVSETHFPSPLFGVLVSLLGPALQQEPCVTVQAHFSPPPGTGICSLSGGVPPWAP